MRLGVVLTLAAMLQGCSAFQDHNEKTREARIAFERGQFDSSLSLMEKDKESKLDGLCFQLDSGIVAQVGGKFDRSNAEFEHAENTVQGFEDRGLNGSVIAEEIGSVAVNEKTIPYQGEAFEKVFVPVFRARNYLLQGNLDDAMVEVRRIWKQQDIVKQLHDKELKESESEADSHKVDRSKLGEVEGKVVYPADALKSPESVYEITYAHYLAALVAEKLGKTDDALISMKSAAKIRPDLPFVALDILRLARIQGNQQTFDDTKKAWPTLVLPGKDDGSVALLFDCGWAPHKRELKILLPSFSTFGAIAIPLYERTPNPAAYARLTLGDRSFTTAILSDVDAIAFKYHRKGLVTRILKQILRATIKMAAGEGAAAGVRQGGKSQIGGLAAGLTVGVYNYVSEQADLRAWLTLPQTFQAVRAWAPAGVYEARVDLCDLNGSVLNSANLGTVTIRPRSLQFVTARSLDRSLFAAIHKDAGLPLPIPVRAPETPPPPPRVEEPPPPKVEEPPPPKVEEPPPPRVEDPKPADPKPEDPKPADPPKPEARKCPGCGDTILDPGVTVCPSCGTPLKKD